MNIHIVHYNPSKEVKEDREECILNLGAFYICSSKELILVKSILLFEGTTGLDHRPEYGLPMYLFNTFDISLSRSLPHTLKYCMQALSDKHNKLELDETLLYNFLINNLDKTYNEIDFIKELHKICHF